MTTHRSENWSFAHTAVNDALTELLNVLRDNGYNPSLHISYDRHEHRLMVDPVVLNKHPDVKSIYLRYIDACKLRDEAVEAIQELPKLDLGF
jgi:uncharacterized protein (UPF0297 family)